jgi:hypothetical protein
MVRSFCAAIVAVSSLALADITLVNEAVANGKTRLVTLSAKANKSFFEMKEADGPTRTMLRDADAKKLFIIDHQKKLVLVITEEDSKAQEEKQAAFRAQMQAQLAKMPPEQRARMEQTMLGQADGKPVVYSYEKKKTPPRKLSGFTCQDYAIKREGQSAGEGCYASWKDVGLSAEEFKSVMVKVMPKGPGGPMGQSMEAADSAPGFPVYRQHVNAEGVMTAETTLKSISKTALAAENFELPKGYAEKTMAEGMGRPPGPPPPPPAPLKK